MSIRSARVFLSHAHEDQSWADFFNTVLTRHGVPCWQATISAKPGKAWRRQILNALADCEHFVVLVSETSSGSAWVREEVESALEAAKTRVIPVLIDGSPPDGLSPRLATVQGIRFYEDYTSGFHELLGLFSREFLHPASLRVSTEERRRSERRVGADRRRSTPLMRLRFGLKMCLQRYSATPLLNSWSPSAFELQRVGGWFMEEAKRYRFSEFAGGKEEQPERVLADAIEWVNYTHGHRADMKMAYLADYVAEFASSNYRISFRDRRAADNRRKSREEHGSDRTPGT